MCSKIMDIETMEMGMKAESRQGTQPAMIWAEVPTNHGM